MNFKVNTGMLDIKRFRFPLTFTCMCPKCKSGASVGFEMVDYLSYPELGKNIEYPVYCEECDDHFEINIKLELHIEVTDSK